MMTGNDRVARALSLLIVGFAGFCSLVYQVVWERLLKYNFGGDSISAAIVTATFLFGLGMGAVMFGRWRPRPFTVFALVELVLGAYVIASYHVLAPLATVLGTCPRARSPTPKACACPSSSRVGCSCCRRAS